MDLRPGERAGRYTLVEPLGEGGQGSVWKIIDPERGVVRALKLIDVAGLPPSATERARLEVDAVNRAGEHPALVPCHDAFSLADGRLGLVFDLVRGSELLDVSSDPRMTPDHREAVLDQLASALAHLHRRGIVHRDLKPGNVLVTDAFWSTPRAAGSVKLVDFGIASMVATPMGLTAVGGFVGTPPYIAPEILSPHRHAARREVARDVFAFGVLGWELFTGAHPTGLPLDAPVEAYARAYETAADGRSPWPPAGPTGPLAEVLAACLALDPAARIADGPALERALGGRRTPRRAGRTKPHETPTEPFSSALPPTSVHALEPHRDPIAVTTPMPGPLLHPSASAPDSTLRIAPPTAPRRASWLPWIVAAILGVAAVAGMVALIAGHEDRAPEPAPFVVASPGPVTSPDPPPPPQPTATPCCSDGRACASGRICGPCAATRLPSERWLRLRLTGVARGAYPVFSKDLASTHPTARVCLRRQDSGDDWLCAPLTKMVATGAGDRDDRLRVRTSDLERGRVELTILEGDALLAAGTSSPNPNGVQTTALCYGLLLYVGPRETSTYLIRGYLDDD